MRSDPLVLSLANQLTFIVETALEHRFDLPFLFVIVGANGEMMYFRYIENPEGTALLPDAKHLQSDKGFMAPVNMVVIDSNGEAVRSVWRGPGTKLTFVN